MENTHQTQRKNINTKKLKAAIYLKYGQELDDTSVIILSILVDEQNAIFSTQNQKIDAAAEKINNSQRSLQVNQQRPGWQAFWFGFGKLGFSIVIATIIAAIMFTIYRNDRQENRPALMQWYRNYYNNTKGMASKKEVAEYVRRNPKPQ